MIVRPASTSIATLLLTLKGSIIPVIWPRVLYTMVLSLLVVAAERQGVSLHFALSEAPLTLLGLALAIFLGFRNNAAYQRWWEARTLWGELIVSARNLARQSASFMPTLGETPRRELLYGVIGFSHALRHHLRSTPPEADLESWFAEDARRHILEAGNRPAAALDILGGRFVENARQVGVPDMWVASLDRELGKLSHVLGGCERIKGTPIPFAYILLLHRTVHIYCFLLPFCLIGPLGWLTPLAVGVISYTFFGLDAIGEQIEDPFDLLPNDLPLDALCRTIEINLRTTLGETDLPKPPEAKDFVLS